MAQVSKGDWFKKRKKKLPAEDAPEGKGHEQDPDDEDEDAAEMEKAKAKKRWKR